jgi:hypothetical protein
MDLIDLQKIVTKTAVFVAAPLVQLLAFGALLSLVARVNVISSLVSVLRSLFGSDYPGTIQFLKDIELLPLIPLITLFLFFLLLFIIKHGVASIAQLLPPHIALHNHVLIALLAAPQHTLALWNKFPQLGIEDVVATVEACLQELAAAAHGDLHKDVTYWRKRAAYFMRGFDSLKVLAYFAFVCGIVAAIRGEQLWPATMHVFGALVVIVAGATIALAQSLNCTYQETATFTKLWSASDDIWSPTDEVIVQQQQVDALTKFAMDEWWHFRLIKVGSLKHYWDILRGRAA